MKIFMIPFFIVHYNGFVAVQFVFVVLFSAISMENPDASGFFSDIEFIDNFWGLSIFAAIGALFFTHGFSFFHNYVGKKEYLKTDISKLMFMPYKRIFLQQILVIGGAFLLVAFQIPNVFLFLLVGLKIAVDLFSHNKSHKEDEQTPPMIEPEEQNLH